MALTAESSMEDILAALTAASVDVATARDLIAEHATEAPTLRNPPDGYTHPGGAPITLAWWAGGQPEATPPSTPTTHVWGDNGGTWAWVPA
jgi:hypothetical protein